MRDLWLKYESNIRRSKIQRNGNWIAKKEKQYFHKKRENK